MDLSEKISGLKNGLETNVGERGKSIWRANTKKSELPEPCIITRNY